MPCELPRSPLDGLDLLTLRPFLVAFELPLLSAQAIIRGEEFGQKARPHVFRNHTSVHPPLAIVVQPVAPSLPRHGSPLLCYAPTVSPLGGTTDADEPVRTASLPPTVHAAASIFAFVVRFPHADSPEHATPPQHAAGMPSMSNSLRLLKRTLTSAGGTMQRVL